MEALGCALSREMDGGRVVEAGGRCGRVLLLMLLLLLVGAGPATPASTLPPPANKQLSGREPGRNTIKTEAQMYIYYFMHVLYIGLRIFFLPTRSHLK